VTHRKSAIVPVLGIIFYLLPVSFLRCEDTSAVLRTELVELQRIQTRVLLDRPQSRFVYIEKRSTGDPVLHPGQWTLGIATPVVTAGPVALGGILPQLYNPLAHGAGSGVFSESTEVALDIGSDIGGRSGVVLEVIPRHWEWFVLYREDVGAQVGSLIGLSFGGRAAVELLGLLSNPSDQLRGGGEESWFVDPPPFAGGLLSHLAGSFAFDLQPVSLYLSASVSGAQRVLPGAVYSLRATWTGRRSEIILLIGHCTDHFLTPEGRSGDLEWIFATRLVWYGRSSRLFGSYRREIDRLPLIPAPFRESRDLIALGAVATRRAASRCLLHLQAEAEMERRWSSSGFPEQGLCLEGGGTLDWHLWELSAGMAAEWGSENGWERDLRLLWALDPVWGRLELEMELQSRPTLGWHLSVDVELKGEAKRLYARVETRRALPFRRPERDHGGLDFFDLLSVCIGLEAETTWSR
jgi:hypothetical protein